MKENKLVELSMDFAVKIIRFCDNFKGHGSLLNQLERSSTSIGANVREANYAHGKADFVAKLQIALKECYETEYWLELLVRAELATKEEISDKSNTCGTIRRLLIRLLILQNEIPNPFLVNFPKYFSTTPNIRFS